jgi:hypothetical protein
MENQYIFVLVIVGLYVLTRFIMMKFVDKENLPLKLIAKDGLIVGLSSWLSFFIIGQFYNVKADLIGGSEAVQVFTTEMPMIH